jgi:MFS family permease
VKGYSTLSAGVHTLPFAIVAAIFTPLGAVLALKIGSRAVVTSGLLLMGGGLVVAAFNSEASTAYWGPILVSMVLLALGLSALTAPTAEAVMGSVPDEQRGAAGAVNNTTRELGGTLGVAVFGSVFASAYAPKIINAFRPLPIPAGPKGESHQSVAAALAVVGHAPHSVRPALDNVVFTAFHSGLRVSAIAGAGVALLGALLASRLLPGRSAEAQATAAVTEEVAPATV